MNRLFKTILGLFFAILFSAGAYAQGNSIYFPYVVNDTQTTTEIILSNVSGQDAVVSISAYREDATAAAASPVTVPANAQIVVAAAAGFKGWIVATPDAPGVLGNLRVSSPSRTSQDTTESAQLGAALMFPLVAQSSGASTEIAVVNTSGNRVRAALTLFDKNGGTVAATEAPLAAFGMLRGSIAAIFGIDKNYSAASHVIARFLPASILSPIVDIPGMGFEIVRGFTQTDPLLEKISTRSDWAALTATPVEAAATSFGFPNVSRGTDAFSLIGLVNASDAAQTITLTYATASNPGAGSRSISIPGNGAVRMTVTDLFGPGQDSGVLRVAGGRALITFMAAGTPGGSAFAATSGQSSPQREFFLPGIDETPPATTSLALVNDGAAPAVVDLFLLSPGGSTVGLKTEILAAGQRLLRPLSAEIAQALNTKGGFLFVRSTEPLFGTVIAGAAEITLNQIVARATVPGYVPPPTQTSSGVAAGRFSITGTIRDFLTGAPASGVTVTLSRTGLTEVVTTTTDASGAYAFNNLPAGEYKLTPTQTGRAFTPPNATVQISDSSAVVDFTREILPVISALTVITNDKGPQSTAGNNPDAFAVFGTAEVTVRIDGLNFVGPKGSEPGQKVYFGSRAINSDYVNFVDAQTIFVRLNLNSLEILEELAKNGYYGRYDITIAGQPPFDASRSNALPFYILPPVPVLLDVQPRQTTARYEINSLGQPLTITGFGFRPGARLLFDGGTALNGIEIDTTFVSSTELRAFLPPQALKYGGMYLLRVRNVSLLPEVSGEAVVFQVNNLKPQLLSVFPNPLEIIGPGARPTIANIAINGSNFFPGSVPAITAKVPENVPALVPVGGPQQCIVVNGIRTLRVRAINVAGVGASTIPVTFTSLGINTNQASGAFIPGVNTETMTVVTDGDGFAPPLGDDYSYSFQANPFTGKYPVIATAVVDGITLTTAFNMTNVAPDEACAPDSRAGFTLVNSNQIIVTNYPFYSRGTYSIFVANPAPGGGTSNELEFEVKSGPSSNVPTLRLDDPLSPSTRQANSEGFNLTVYRDTSVVGSFEGNAWVNFGTVRLTRIAGDTDLDSITVFVPGFLIGSSGIVPVSVTNPGTDGTTGGTSTRVFFTVTP